MEERLLPEYLECTLCLKMFYDPVSISCGHTYCRACLRRSLLECKMECGLCRTPVDRSVVDGRKNVVIANILEDKYKEMYREREREVEEEMGNLRRREEEFRRVHGDAILPLFLYPQIVAPEEPVGFRFFEPRYIEMIRRCLNSDRIFGIQNSTEEGAIGTSIEILTCNQTRENHYMVTGRGKRRYRTRAESEVEPGTFGLHTASIEYLEDDEAISQEEKVLVSRMHARVSSAMDFLRPSQRAEIAARFRPIPAADDWSGFAFWLISCLKISQPQKTQLLESTSLSERIRNLAEIMESFDHIQGKHSQKLFCIHQHGPEAFSSTYSSVILFFSIMVALYFYRVAIPGR